MRSLRAGLLMVAGWMLLFAARPNASADSDRELNTAAAVDVSIAAPVIRYAVVRDLLESVRVSRVTPLALFICAAALLMLAVQTVERARVASSSAPKVLDPRVIPYDAMAPPVSLVTSSAAV